MRSFRGRALPLAVALAAAASAACTDARLQPAEGDEIEKVDDLLRIEGELCTAPADEVTFPVKILFLIDQSASLQCTDAANQRFTALNRVVSELYPLPNVQFGFVGFSSWSRRVDFTRSMEAIQPFLDPSGGLGPATDYQGSLATALQMLEKDMIDAGPAERARTKYVVVFMSDGSAEPRCNPGCEDDRTACGNGRDDDGDGLADGADPDCTNVTDAASHPDSLYPVCNTDGDYRDQVASGTYVDMQGVCPAYNMPDQILQRIADIRALEDAYSAGSVTLHSVLLFAEQSAVDAVCPDAAGQFGYEHDRARALLQAMADAGGGTFRDVNLQREDDGFLSFDFTSLESNYWLTELIAQNRNARPTASGPIPDRDTDGLSDADESALGSDPDLADTDADGYSDLFEVRFRGSGFDPVDPEAPALPCTDTADVDGDGLNTCEEQFLGSDVRLPDTDGDRIPDGLELTFETDPLIADALDDPDFDGLLNREEIRSATLPLTADLDRWRSAAVRYGLTDLGDRKIPNAETGEEETRRCYRFRVSRLQLVVTPTTRDRGLNRVYVDALEEPVQLVGSRPVVHRACVEVFYLGETYKDPPSGVVDLSQPYWDDLRTTFDGRLAALASACGFEPEGFNRGQLESILADHTGPKVQVGRFMYPRDDLRDLMRRYFTSNLSLRVPEVAPDVFVPIELFDPETDCLKPWEIGRLSQLLDTLEAACREASQ